MPVTGGSPCPSWSRPRCGTPRKDPIAPSPSAGAAPSSPPCRVPQASGDVIWFQVRIGLKDLALALTGGQEVENIAYPDAHPADAGPANALIWVDCYPVEQVSHRSSLFQFSSSIPEIPTVKRRALLSTSSSISALKVKKFPAKTVSSVDWKVKITGVLAPGSKRANFLLSSS